MARHLARSRGVAVAIGVLLAATSVLLTAAIDTGSAGAVTAPGKSVVIKNGVVLGRCNVTVQSVNPSVGTASVRLAANAQPATLFGYGSNAYTQVFCRVYSNAGALLTSFAPFVNGPILPTTSETPDIAFAASYILCGQAFVKLNNGNDSLTPQVCT